MYIGYANELHIASVRLYRELKVIFDSLHPVQPPLVFARIRVITHIAYAIVSYHRQNKGANFFPLRLRCSGMYLYWSL